MHKAVPEELLRDRGDAKRRSAFVSYDSCIDTSPTFPARLRLLVSWLPNAEPFKLPNAAHLLHLQNPRGMAEALTSFYARHPLTT